MGMIFHKNNVFEFLESRRENKQLFQFNCFWSDWLQATDRNQLVASSWLQVIECNKVYWKLERNRIQNLQILVPQPFPELLTAIHLDLNR